MVSSRSHSIENTQKVCFKTRSRKYVDQSKRELETIKGPTWETFHGGRRKKSAFSKFRTDRHIILCDVPTYSGVSEKAQQLDHFKNMRVIKYLNNKVVTSQFFFLFLNTAFFLTEAAPIFRKSSKYKLKFHGTWWYTHTHPFSLLFSNNSTTLFQYKSILWREKNLATTLFCGALQLSILVIWQHCQKHKLPSHGVGSEPP